MRKALIIIGGLFFCLLLICFGFFIYFLTSSKQLEQSGQQYVDATIPVLTTNWNPDDFKSHASKELLVYLQGPDFEKLYVMFRKLGPLVRYNGSNGSVHSKLTIPDGLRVTATYVATADFENASGTMKMSLIRRGNKWEIF